ncbi:MAG: filamentous hemagglutinin N-terminal domain-containing protein [Betaproteobacteria bacterium]|nr:filamentous hemagglutinin N-terminal domain-containing protein [Betaproteobacteria bacterium]
MQSNGRVFLINPNGILFGQGARIEVQGLTASTLNISNADFLAGKLNFQAGAVAGKVENQGQITTPQGGQVYLIGSDVTNSGIITSPKGEVILAAGRSVKLVDSDDPNLRVEITAGGTALNLGSMITAGGKAGIYAGVIQQKGSVRADSVVRGENGRIVFKASGNVTLDKGSVTSASGKSAGEVHIQSDTGTTLVSGRVEAKASEDKGGTIRILGENVGLIDQAVVDASGANGGGTILIGGDFQGAQRAGQERPVRVHRSGGAGARRCGVARRRRQGDRLGGRDCARARRAQRARRGDWRQRRLRGNLRQALPGGDASAGPVGAAGPGRALVAGPGRHRRHEHHRPQHLGRTGFPPTSIGSPSLLSTSTLEAALNNGGSVTLDTSLPGGTGNGDVTINAPVTKTGGSTSFFAILANRNVNINYAITSNASALNVNITADQDNNGSGNVNIGSQVQTAGGNFSAIGQWVDIAAGGNVTTGGGSITLTALGNAGITHNGLGKLHSNGGAIKLMADSMWLSGGASAIDAGASVVTLTRANANVEIRSAPPTATWCSA